MRFRHPLLRSAAYLAADADADERRAAHAALAEATDPHRDPDRPAWHRAYAAGAADEEVAAELIGSADRAQRRGGVAAAAAFWERAMVLTPAPGRRAARALIAAEAKYAAGDFAATGKLLAAADIGPLDEHGHARVESCARGSPSSSTAAPMRHHFYYMPRSACSRWMRSWRGRPFWNTPGRHLRRPSGGWVRSSGGGAGGEIRSVGPRAAAASALAPARACGTGTRRLCAAAPLLKDALGQYLAQPRELDVLCHPYCFVAAELWDEEAWFEIANGQVQLARSSGTRAGLSKR